jgi:hypothetical protein
MSDKKKALTGLAVLFVAVIILAVGTSACSCSSDTAEVTLNAEVSYNDGQFTITNNDSFTWTDVKLYVKSDRERTGYTYITERLEANTTYTLDYKPQKPFSMSIHCKTPDGKDGWWFGEWK